MRGMGEELASLKRRAERAERAEAQLAKAIEAVEGQTRTDRSTLSQLVARTAGAASATPTSATLASSLPTAGEQAVVVDGLDPAKWEVRVKMRDNKLQWMEDEERERREMLLVSGVLSRLGVKGFAQGSPSRGKALFQRALARHRARAGEDQEDEQEEEDGEDGEGEEEEGEEEEEDEEDEDDDLGNLSNNDDSERHFVQPRELRYTVSAIVPEAPLEGGNLALVFSSVENPGPLWDCDPVVMRASVGLYFDVAARLLAEHGGTVVSKERDGMVCSFGLAENAVRWAVGLEERLYEEDWGPDFDARLGALLGEAEGHRGLRVRVGMDFGAPVLHGALGQYGGPLVQAAGGLSLAASGGQVLCSGAVRDLTVAGLAEDALSWQELGVHRMRETGIEVQVWSVLPASLGARRRFGPIDTVTSALRSRGEARAQERAAAAGPPAPTGLLALVFTDVQNSTALWDTDADVMAVALEAHDRVMRDTIAECGGYEVKTEGDAFMVAFQDAVSAVRWCLLAQERLMDAPWSDPLLEYPDAAPAPAPPLRTLFLGLRVRMGVHYGEPIVKEDPVTHRADYFGPVVNLAARVGACGHGGQVVVSEQAMTLVRGQEDQLQATVKPLGEHSVKGIRQPVTLYEVLPKSLAARSEAFAPIKTATTASGGSKATSKGKGKESPAPAPKPAPSPSPKPAAAASSSSSSSSPLKQTRNSGLKNPVREVSALTPKPFEKAAAKEKEPASPKVKAAAPPPPPPPPSVDEIVTAIQSDAESMHELTKVPAAQRWKTLLSRVNAGVASAKSSPSLALHAASPSSAPQASASASTPRLLPGGGAASPGIAAGLASSKRLLGAPGAAAQQALAFSERQVASLSGVLAVGSDMEREASQVALRVVEDGLLRHVGQIKNEVEMVKTMIRGVDYVDTKRLGETESKIWSTIASTNDMFNATKVITENRTLSLDRKIEMLGTQLSLLERKWDDADRLLRGSNLSRDESARIDIVAVLTESARHLGNERQERLDGIDAARARLDKVEVKAEELLSMTARQREVYATKQELRDRLSVISDEIMARIKSAEEALLARAADIERASREAHQALAARLDEISARLDAEIDLRIRNSIDPSSEIVKSLEEALMIECESREAGIEGLTRILVPFRHAVYRELACRPSWQDIEALFQGSSDGELRVASRRALQRQGSSAAQHHAALQPRPPDLLPPSPSQAGLTVRALSPEPRPAPIGAPHIPASPDDPVYHHHNPLSPAPTPPRRSRPISARAAPLPSTEELVDSLRTATIPGLSRQPSPRSASSKGGSARRGYVPPPESSSGKLGSMLQQTSAHNLPPVQELKVLPKVRSTDH